MSCDPTSTGCLLSPSDEGRFVPRSPESVVDASPVTEHLFTAAKQSDTIDGEKSSTTEEVVASGAGEESRTIQDATEELTDVAADENGILIAQYNNQLHKNVTPHRERKLRMRRRKGHPRLIVFWPILVVVMITSVVLMGLETKRVSWVARLCM